MLLLVTALNNLNFSSNKLYLYKIFDKNNQSRLGVTLCFTVTLNYKFGLTICKLLSA
jgi:hypothetical protein